VYQTAEEAIHKAYAIEGREIYKGPSFFSGLTGSTVQGVGESPWDRLADAVNIIYLCNSAMNIRQSLALRTYHTLPTPLTMGRKQLLIRTTGLYLWSYQQHRGNRHFVTDIVREWSGLKRHHNDLWWADHMGVSPSTINYIKAGRKDRKNNGLIEILDSWLSEAYRTCDIPLSEAGIIP
jgi:hypothetical protein